MLKHAIATLTILILGCGSGGSGSHAGQTLTVAESERYAAVEQCVGWSAPAPTVRYGEVIPCPETGRLCCLASAGYFECPELQDLNGDGIAQCGSTGQYADGVIVLPIGCDDAFAHESVHHLLDARSGDPDGDHAAAEFQCGA